MFGQAPRFPKTIKEGHMPLTAQTLIALVLSGVFVALALLHLAWALGFRWGGDSLLPQDPDGMPLFSPGAVACLVVALVFLLPAVILLVRVGILPADIPAWVPAAGVWGIAAVLLLRAIGDFRYAGFTKRVRNTEFARRDSLFYSPLCVVLAALCTAVQLL
jgi:hypothetical protein